MPGQLRGGARGEERTAESDGWGVEREGRDAKLLENVWELLVWAKSTPGN